MGLSRNITTKIHFVLDQFLPPVLRDSKLFMYLPFRILYGKTGAKVFMEFKTKAPTMSEEEFSKVYANINTIVMERETDLNSECIREILKNIKGNSVLEVGCGKALLATRIENKGHLVTAADIHVDNSIRTKYPRIKFMNENVEHLSFRENEFDTVVCTHTLEHVQDLTKSIAELRRVAKKRLILVVPKQRPYKYTFDLHLHFFPYTHSFLQAINPREKHTCKTVGGDILYIEDYI